MKPTVVIVGRPNVGKSTLFNRLTRTRDAIVADAPGITRDRHYGEGRMGGKPYLVVDTGGFEPVAKDGIFHQMARQARQAVDEADVVLFVVDARVGLTVQDREVGAELRRSGRKIWLVVNKAEGMARAVVTADFHALGLGEPLAISAEHGEYVSDLMELVLADFPEPAPESDGAAKHPKIAIVGRPNVGKSTLVNALLGEERVVVFDQPGTTRDSIYIDFERAGKQYTLIDTAGMRKRGRVDEAAEKFSVIKTLQSIADANVAILVLDARQEISEQDAHIAGFILEAGRALVVAVNKWEGLGEAERELVKRDGARKLGFLSFASFHFISALQGQGIGAVLRSADAAYAAAMSSLPTPRLTRALQMAVQQQQPPRAGMVRPKLRYAHQGGHNPPRIIVHGSALERVPDTYRRYLERFFRDAFKLTGTPLRVEFKSGRNPFARTEKRG
ncbi:MAG: ribosome biogenesis GTPase Der [Burkholderiales bacterium]|nr:ribosome biogenesis GTPase Der [Burkholderiales bacterium]MDP2397421.1 ribosome biogenesis GTPase Der [Burkholderiales bacterium]